MNIEVQAEYSIITSSGGYNAVMTIVFFSQMGKPIFEVEGSVFFVSMLKQNLEEKKSQVGEACRETRTLFHSKSLL